MFRKGNNILESFGEKLGGPNREVEADETFVGGKARNMHSSERKRHITARGVDAKSRR
ncbi:MAG TPA: hypothetical protein VN943_15475 [Candidatus Acidoferrum sp.]|nr:hypothetical protein [Candidatus Acidoferrum sp.]